MFKENIGCIIRGDVANTTFGFFAALSFAHRSGYGKSTPETITIAGLCWWWKVAYILSLNEKDSQIPSNGYVGINIWGFILGLGATQQSCRKFNVYITNKNYRQI